MVSYFNAVAEAFWNEEFWLPPNVSWALLDQKTDSTPAVRFCQYRDLAIPLCTCWVMLAVKFVLENVVFRAVGRYAGLPERNKSKMPPTNEVLEAEYQSGRRLDHANISRLAKDLDMSERQVERWLRQRLLVGKSSKLDKFCESAWRCLFYSSLYTYAWVVLWDKKWFWSITACWFDFPYHDITDDIWWYYMIELSYYWSCIISQFFDVKRKDFWEMFLHHIATIALLSISWTTNFFRVGTLVLWVHDLADVFLETAKMFKYLGKNVISDLLFYGFASSWVITRLGYLPTWIIYSITVEAPQFVEYFPMYHVFSLLLSTLVILHLFWAYYIFKVAYIAMMTPDGKIERDLRSESASSD